MTRFHKRPSGRLPDRTGYNAAGMSEAVTRSLVLKSQVLLAKRNRSNPTTSFQRKRESSAYLKLEELDPRLRGDDGYC